ncbi:hypothetical protein ALC53_00129 [Atta colombica]|uniref:Uncharacterized protein n=1 Tax=Atta colombica TaxID=520822 RepID=A0A195BZ48_9HYME|nr:hypothetical protein ALC53_00129 [Atta colombica]
MEHVESVTTGCPCIYLSHVKCAAQCIFVRNSHLVRYTMSRAHCVHEASIKIIPKYIEGLSKNKHDFVPVIVLYYKPHFSSKSIVARNQRHDLANIENKYISWEVPTSSSVFISTSPFRDLRSPPAEAGSDEDIIMDF